MLNEAFVDEQSLALLRWAYRKTGDSRQAEELAQEVWVQVLNAVRHGSEPIRDMERFLWKVAKYVWYRSLRRKSRQIGWVSVEETDLPDGTDFPEDIADADEMRQQLSWIRRRIVSLNTRQREIMLLFYLDGLSVREVARRLDVSEATVKWHLHDIRRKLKEESNHMSSQEFLYRPRQLHMGINGQCVPQLDTFFIENSPVKQNLCIACYQTPQSLPQLSEYLGIPAGYLEPDLQWLVEKEFLTETPHGYSTTFMINTVRDKQDTYAIIKRHRSETADVIVNGLLEAEDAIRAIGFHGSDQPINKLLWLLIYRLFNYISMPTTFMDPPFRPDGGRYWPLGFDVTAEGDIELAVDTRGWAYNGSMHNDNFRWFGLYNFGVTEIPDLMDSFTPEWKQLHDTLCILIHSGNDMTGMNDQQRLDLAKLAQKGFVTIDGDRAIPNFCVFTEPQLKQLVDVVFRPIIDRVEPGLRALVDDLTVVCRDRLPPQLRYMTNQVVWQAAFDTCYLTYIFAMNDGKLYDPTSKEDGMFLTMTYLRR
ncbi:MAG: RNA polymerase sigma factor [Christensenellaceae bacterium]|nr:RNA polymerase sigma factor [Christensenellaceae bacterium]